MNWRMKLADWISGGELSRMREAHRRTINVARMDRDELWRNLTACRDDLFVMGIAMQKIADMETPRANATVRRMAAVAKAVLK